MTLPHNHGQSWTDTDYRTLESLNARNHKIAYIATHMGRTTLSIQCKLEKMGLAEPKEQAFDNVSDIDRLGYLEEAVAELCRRTFPERFTEKLTPLDRMTTDRDEYKEAYRIKEGVAMRLSRKVLDLKANVAGQEGTIRNYSSEAVRLKQKIKDLEGNLTTTRVLNRMLTEQRDEWREKVEAEDEWAPGTTVRVVGNLTTKGQTGIIVGYRWPYPNKEPKRRFITVQFMGGDTLTRTEVEFSQYSLEIV